MVTDVAVAPDAPTTDLACEPESANATCAPSQLEPVTVTLNSVKPDLIMQWAADGTIWLLPAYTFGSADGGIYTVIAVADAYIQEVDPPIAVSESGVVDSGVVTPDVGAPVPAPVAPAVEPNIDTSVTTTAAP